MRAGREQAQSRLMATSTRFHHRPTARTAYLLGTTRLRSGSRRSPTSVAARSTSTRGPTPMWIDLVAPATRAHHRRRPRHRTSARAVVRRWREWLSGSSLRSANELEETAALVEASRWHRRVRSRRTSPTSGRSVWRSSGCVIASGRSTSAEQRRDHRTGRSVVGSRHGRVVARHGRERPRHSAHLPSGAARDGARQQGRIVNLSSQAGVFRWPLVSAYSVSKAAIVKFTENLAFESAALRRRGVQCPPRPSTDRDGRCRVHGQSTRWSRSRLMCSRGCATRSAKAGAPIPPAAVEPDPPSRVRSVRRVDGTAAVGPRRHRRGARRDRRRAFA